MSSHVIRESCQNLVGKKSFSIDKYVYVREIVVILSHV